jgi:hypothetical protein
MYTETVSDAVWELLTRLNSVPEMKFCYLAGGTALALQLGHRRSEDLGFFTAKVLDDLFLKIETSLEDLDILVVNQSPDHMELMLQSVKVDFIHERIALKHPPNPILPQAGNLRAADPRDIGRMKLLSVASRGSKKDFIDLYCLTRKIQPLKELITTAMGEDSGVRYSKLVFLKGLVDFEDADKEVDPVMVWDVDWEEIKKTLKSEVKGIADEIQSE